MNSLGRETNGSETGLSCWIKLTNNGDGKEEKVIMFMSGKLGNYDIYPIILCVHDVNIQD